jgi:hypothetical protein
MRKTLGGFWAQMDPFAYILPPETAQIHCAATGLALFRMPQVTLYSAALGVAIAQACYVTAPGDNHERAVLQKLLGELDLEGVLIQADALHTQQAFFDSSRSRGPTSS